jgi:hypothetical protein
MLLFATLAITVQTSAQSRTMPFDHADSLLNGDACRTASCILLRNLMLRSRLELSSTTPLSALAISVPASAKNQFITFDVPGAGTGAFQGTTPYVINASGATAGYSTDANNVDHGFLRAADGTITVFDVAGASTDAISLTSSGAISGNYFDTIGHRHAFLRARDGTITTFDVPGSIATVGENINSAGTISGLYRVTLNPNVLLGYVRARDGSITTYDFASFNPPGFYDPTVVPTCADQCMNEAGTITNGYSDLNTVVHGYLRAPDGTITTFETPWAGTVAFEGTVPQAINTGGAVTGFYIDAGDVVHGFLRGSDGTFTSFDPPGSIDTEPHGINPSGAITGPYVDGNFVVHGFVRASGGTFTSFDPPGSIFTFPFGMNPSGAITGVYLDGNLVFHGFVLIR